MSFILSAQFYSDKSVDPIGVDRAWSIRIGKRDEAVRGALSGPILAEIKEVCADRLCNKVCCLLSNESSRTPVWSWSLNSAGEIVSEQCEYAT